MFEEIRVFIKTKKRLVYIALASWFLFVILLGVIIGIFSRPKVIPLSPEEENARSINIIKGDEENIYSGKMLSTKNNLDFKSLEYSRNYVKSRNKNE